MTRRTGTCHAAVNPKHRMATREKRVVGKHDIARFTPDHGFGFPDMKHVPNDALHGALAEPRIARCGGRSKQERAVLRRHTEPLLRIFHDLKP